MTDDPMPGGPEGAETEAEPSLRDAELQRLVEWARRRQKKRLVEVLRGLEGGRYTDEVEILGHLHFFLILEGMMDLEKNRRARDKADRALDMQIEGMRLAAADREWFRGAPPAPGAFVGPGTMPGPGESGHAHDDGHPHFDPEGTTATLDRVLHAFASILAAAGLQVGWFYPHSDPCPPALREPSLTVEEARGVVEEAVAWFREADRLLQLPDSHARPGGPGYPAPSRKGRTRRRRR